MLDAGHIMEEDAAYKRKRHKREGRIPPRPVVPLYTVDDAAACERLFAPVKYEQPVAINNCAVATFHEAGHILAPDDKTASVLQRYHTHHPRSRETWQKRQTLINDPTGFDHADYVLVNRPTANAFTRTSTTSRRRWPKRSTRRAAGGNVVIPSFSVERSQEVLYYLHELLIEKRFRR